jgi:hypothetical protein
MNTRWKPFLKFAIAGSIACTAASAFADGPTKLTSRQLDRVTAGQTAVGALTSATATGNLSLVATTTNSVITGSQPYPGQPGLTNTIGAADGTATAVGTNLGLPGTTAPSAATSVVTGGTADGNYGLNYTVNNTITGAGGVSAQAGWTVVVGTYLGL